MLKKRRPRIAKMSHLQGSNHEKTCVFHVKKEKKPREKKEFFKKKDCVWLDIAWMFTSYGKVSVF